MGTVVCQSVRTSQLIRRSPAFLILLLATSLRGSERLVLSFFLLHGFLNNSLLSGLLIIVATTFMMSSFEESCRGSSRALGSTRGVAVKVGNGVHRSELSVESCTLTVCFWCWFETSHVEPVVDDEQSFGEVLPVLLNLSPN